MDIRVDDPAPPLLSRRWRRALVTVVTASAVGMALLEQGAPPGARLVPAAQLALAGVTVACVWLLADVLRPWIALTPPSAEDQAHADAAVRRSYAVLFWVALGTVVYLQGQGGMDGTAPGVELPAWLLPALIVLLPLGFAAWDDPSAAAEVSAMSPWGVVQARFAGRSAATYATALLLLCVGAGLLLFWSLSPVSREVLQAVSLAVAVVAVAATAAHVRSALSSGA